MVLIPAAALAQTSPRHAVEIVGAEPFDALLTDNLEIVRHQNDADMSQAEWQRLVGITPQAIRELLATEGYFSPTIAYDSVTDAGRTVTRFNVTPGPATHIDAVDIRFSGAIANGPHADVARIENLQRQWNLQPGERFRQEEWTDAKNAILKELLIREHPAAGIARSEARIDPEQRTATLTVEINSGPLFTFGDLKIEGLERYSREIIDTLNPIRPGDPYSQEKLTELQSRLQDSGYFRSVFATIEPDPAQSKQVPVQLTLTEYERRRLALGVGFSTDAGARTQLKWLDRQLFGRNWRLESALLLEQETKMLGADIYFPARDNGWRPSIGTHYEQTDIASEKNDKIRIDARMSGPIKTDETVWAVSYLADRQQIAQTAINNRQALIGIYSHTRRRVDNILTPQRGYVASIELSAGLTGALTEKNIGRVVGDANWLIPLGENWLTVLRGQGGQVIGASRVAVPGDLLFRTGGDQSVRGYAYNSLGVTVMEGQGQAVVGGTVLAVASAELIYKITPAWGAAIFRDAGDAADSWGDFRLKQGTGIGARWRSPIGSVNLDLAYGHAVKKARLHFSIGYGF